MADLKNVLIVDDAKRFDGQTLFEPEYHVYRVADRPSAMAFLQSQNRITLTLINLESSASEGLALLTEIREQTGLDAMVVWICLDADDESGIQLSFEAGADEMVCRLPSTAALHYQIRRLKAFPIRYEGRDTPVFLAGVSDVPSRYRVEAVLRESDRKIAALMNAVPGGIALFDLRDRMKLLYSNPELSRMCGYTAKEYQQIIDKDFHQLLDPRDLAQVDRMIGEYRKRPQRMKAVFRLITKDGSFRWVRVTAIPTGEVLQCGAVFIDITQDKENEIKSERMRCELYYRSEHDALTGINNRETFYRKTSEMLHADPNTRYVILTMDIDRFKVVNDMFGKDVGDRILVAIAEGLRNLLNNIGTCARMEADHFAACLPQKMLDMERVMSLFDEGLKSQKIDYKIELSYGIYQIHNINTPVNHMCDRAVMAMKTIKGNAVNRYAYYDDQLRQAMLEENAVLDEMNSALERGQFVPYLQPIFAIDSDKPVSVEMLVRWNHPEKGFISPNQFIPLFERNGFITKLDFYIWEKACELLRQWKSENYLLPVSVNISRIDLYSTRLCEHLLALVNRYGVEPSMLRLEITESAYCKDPEELVAAINRLRSMGFVILMDDFGSGYSSLNVLMDMPVDMLKLDMRFLSRLNTNPRAASILTSVVRMAKWLNMPIVAEGVETREQLAFLRSIGCDHVQGYLLAKPSDLEAYTREFVKCDSVQKACPAAEPADSMDLSSLWSTSAEADMIFNGMIGGMGIYELCGDVLEIRRVNDGYYELFGYTPKDVFDGVRNALTLVHPDDRAALLETCRLAASTRRVERLEYRKVRPGDNKVVWLEARIRFLGKTGPNDVLCFVFNDITEQKSFEQLRSLRNYAMVLRSVYSSVFEVNLTAGHMRAVHLNQTTTDTGDRPLVELRDYLRSTLLLQDEELEQAIFEDGYLHAKLAEAQNDYYLLERRIAGANGKSRWASFTFVRLPSAAGQEVYLLCVADVDNRKRADELLMENQWLQLKQREQTRYQALLEHLGTSLFEWDTETGKTMYSKGFEQFSISEFDFHVLRSHKDLEPYVYPKDVSLFRIFVNDLLSHGNGAVTLRLLQAGGAPVWCRLLCSLVRETPDRSVRCIAAVNQIDEQMEMRENFLNEQMRFQAFAENFLVGLGIFEMRGERQRILYLSSGYRKMIGYADDERFYNENHPYSGIHPEDVPRFVTATRGLLETGKPYTIDYRVYHKDGHVLWMRSLNTIYPGPEPGVSRIFAVIEEITELHETQMRLDALLNRLPMAIGIYGMNEEPAVRFENKRMNAFLAAMAQNETGSAAGAVRSRGALLSHLQSLRENGVFEADELVSLPHRTAQAQPMRLLSATVSNDHQTDCYCALLSPDITP